jgi:release factor glutamine methyltransferase
MKITEIRKKYHAKIDALDLELIIAHGIRKTREFVLAHPEYKIPKLKIENLKLKISRRMRGEPLAYILGHKEFYGLDFRINQHTLIPRPETELLVELALKEIRDTKYKIPDTIIDIGTGSGNIIIGLAKNLKARNKFIATDISPKALTVAKYNARKHKVDKKIKFLRGNLLEPIIKNTKYQILNTKYIIIANLPYLSKKIYNATAKDVKNYEPKSALLSSKKGLAHYEKLLKQIKKLVMSYELRVTSYLEISPEQKPALQNLVKSILPDAKMEFRKDLAGKWRVCCISL